MESDGKHPFLISSVLQWSLNKTNIQDFILKKKSYGLVSFHPQTHAEIDIYGACIYEQKQRKLSL